VRLSRALRAVAAVGIATSLLLGSAACSTRPPSDSIILYYKAGAGDDKVFGECIEPGKAGSYPVDDEIFALPTSLRTWNIRPAGGDTKDPIKSGSKPSSDGQPGPEVAVYATADFYLNTDCTKKADSPIVQFWEQTGRRYKVSSDGEDGFDEKAWRTMLLNTLVPAEEKALREQTRNYTGDELDANLGGVWRQMERGLGQMFADEVKAKVGGDYFCGTGYQRGKTVEWTETVAKPDGTLEDVKKSGPCPPVRISITDVNFADPGIAAARANVFKAEQEKKAALIKAQEELEKSRLLSQAAQDDKYTELRRIESELEAAKACAANPNCTLILGADSALVGRK
jgi:hypothetical protein